MKVPTLDVAGPELGHLQRTASFGRLTHRGLLDHVDRFHDGTREACSTSQACGCGRREDTGGYGRGWSKAIQERKVPRTWNPRRLVGSGNSPRAGLGEETQGVEAGGGHRQAADCGEHPRFSLHQNPWREIGSRDLGGIVSNFPEQIPDGCCKPASEAPVGALRCKRRRASSLYEAAHDARGIGCTWPSYF